MDEETKAIKCEDCGWIGSPKEASYEIYGGGRDKTFGLCPQCKGLGKFRRVNCPKQTN